jgi:RTX calcium-binding nonapeptide repeat (4 copies)
MKRGMLLALSAVVLITTVAAISAPEDANARRRPRCHGKRATLVGTRGPDRIVGDGRDDVIVARGGNDVITTGRGNDTICAGRGNDVVDGSRGKDPTWGGRGTDICTASRPREHRFHHQCERHQGASFPGGGIAPRSLPEAPGPSVERGRAMARDDFVVGWWLPPVERKDDICGGAHCEYFGASALRTLGFAGPQCNAQSNDVDTMHVNVSAGVYYAVRAWFRYWDFQAGTWRWSVRQDFIYGDSRDAVGPSAFHYIPYPRFNAGESIFQQYYEGYLWNPNTGSWSAPTVTTHSIYVLTGPWNGAQVSELCITWNKSNDVVITYT